MSKSQSCPSSVPGCEGPSPPGTVIHDRRALLDNLAVGDIFHASAPNGASLICLATGATDAIVQARTITHQMHLEFDRKTGIAEWNPAKGRPGKGSDDLWIQCTIDSVAPLPPDIHNVMLFIDRVSRLKHLHDGAGMSEPKKHAFLFVYSYYRENPLPGADIHDRAVEAGLIDRCLAPYLIPGQATAPRPSRRSRNPDPQARRPR